MAEDVKNEWPFICPSCERLSTAQVRGHAYWYGEGAPIAWTMVQCDQCDMPALQMREDFGGGFDDDAPVTIYPAPSRLSTNVPNGLRREWEEAQTCFKAKAYSACVVMVRRTLEGTTEDQGVSKGPLAKRLEKLAADGRIDATLAEWADALRIIGNQGAHYTGSSVRREDAEDALAFAEALLDHIYVLRKRFAEFKKRLDG